MKPIASLALDAGLMAACAENGQTTSMEAKTSYVASVSREPFNRPACKWAQRIATANLRTFKTRADAVHAGHRPCKVGKP